MAAPITTQEMVLLLSNVKVTADPVSGINSSEMVGGKLYQLKVVVPQGQVSKAILIPQGNIVAIDYSYPEAPDNIYATLSSKADIVGNTADWQAIPANSSLSLAVTALYIDNTVGASGAVTVTINCRMEG